jgi:hypothetical protein
VRGLASGYAANARKLDISSDPDTMLVEPTQT